MNNNNNTNNNNNNNNNIDRLSLIGSQDALILLRASFSAPRVQHLLRCSPSVDNAALTTFDNLLRSALNRITNCDLSGTQWLQASLTVKEGGLGVRRVTSLALPAFLSSGFSGEYPITSGIHIVESLLST